MIFSARLQLLLCLVVYVSCAHAIMVKYGTKGGPIEPPPPEPPLPAPQPHRNPAPVWEERPSDVPDPNAQWRPQLFIPQPRYTQLVFKPQPTPQPINNAQSFANSYLPNHQPVQAKPITRYFTPSQILSSQALPGFGIRYFIPAYKNEQQQQPQNKQQIRQDDAPINQIDANDVTGGSRDSAHELQWKHEKDVSKRVIRHTLEATPYPYQWPAYVPHRHG